VAVVAAAVVTFETGRCQSVEIRKAAATIK